MAEPKAQGGDRPLDRPAVAFTWRGFLRGAWRALPVAASTVAFGLVLGVLSRRAGLSFGEVCLMSALVFTGSGQVIAIGMWASPIPVIPIVETTMLVGLRHILMGLTLQPWYSQLPVPAAYGSYFLLTDESWGLTTVDFQRRPADGAFLGGRRARLVRLLGHLDRAREAGRSGYPRSVRVGS